MMTRLKSLCRIPILLFVSTILLSSCGDDGDPFPNPNGESLNHVLFVYMGGDNNLSGFATSNINEIIEGATTDYVDGRNRVIIFQDSRAIPNPRLLMVTPGETGGEVEVLEEYIEYETETTADMEVFTMALNDAREHTEGALSYGLIMWSHATGWLPGTNNPNDWWRPMPQFKSRALYEDSGVFIELEEFAEHLPSGLFDYIIFDECYMAGVEVAWALKDKTKQLLVSSGEVMGAGLPYSDILPYIFQTPAKLGRGGVGEVFYSHYKNQKPNPSDVSNTATTALWNCSEIDDEFADIFKEIIEHNRSALVNLPLDGIQFYDRYHNTNKLPNVIYDIKGYMETLSDSDEEGQFLLDKFNTKLAKIVEYKAITEYVFGIKKYEEQYSGMTSYIPIEKHEVLNEKYRETKWYKRAYPQ